MTTSVVFTFVGVDKPGLVEALSNTVSSQGGSWLESRMSQLAGHFAGIVRVQIAQSNETALCDALSGLNSDNLSISIQDDNSNVEQQEHRQLNIQLIGNDRPGIVLELSSALAEFNINVCEMNTHVRSAPMTAELLFEAAIEIQVPSTLNIGTLQDRLDDIANELSVDINLEQ